MPRPFAEPDPEPAPAPAHPGAQVIALPLRSAPMPGARVYRLCDLARLLGMADQDRRYLIAKLRTLHRLEGLPLPRTPRIWNGALCRDERAIHARSVWDAAAFDAWLHRPDPAAPAPAALPPPPPALRDHLRQRATILAGGRA